jgi:ferredoxin
MDTARLSYIKNGESLKIDPVACTGCGLCIEVCPHDVLGLAATDAAAPGTAGTGGAGRQRAQALRPELCMACGACKLNCPARAITVETGVGCVAAIINGLRSGSAPSCDCGGADGRKGGVCC